MSAPTARRKGPHHKQKLDVVDLRAVDREICLRQFRRFVPDAFEVVEGGDAHFSLVRAGKRSPKFIGGWHIDAIADHLQAVAEDQIKRLLINVPPGTSKSILACVLWPAWLWARDPSLRFLFSSYSEDFTKRDCRRTKALIESDWYRSLFPEVKLKRDPDTVMEHHTTAEGERHGASTGSGVTGKHVHCLPAGVRVRTELGDLDIAELVAMRERPRVLSMNHRTGKLEWRRVQAVNESRTNELFEIRTGGGRSLRATGEHPLFVRQRGYRQARDLADGEALLAVGEVPGMRHQDRQAERCVQNLLRQGEKSRARDRVLCMRQAIREAVVRVREGAAAKARLALLLLARVFDKARRAWLRERRFAQLLDVQDTCAFAPASEVLRGGVPPCGEGLAEKDQGAQVRGVRGDVSAEEFSSAFLREGVREQGSRDANDREGQLALQGREELCPLVRPDARADSRARQWLRRLWDDDRQDCDPSHRRGRGEQHAGEPRGALRALSPPTSQIEVDAVSVVERSRCNSVAVYDLQVEGNHNFFANEILVHNCIVEDDPLKAQDARSPRAREEVWDYRTQTLGFRLLPEAGWRIVIMQRLHEDDPSGRILARAGKDREEDPDEYVHLCLPMEYEPQRRCTTALFADPRKEEGELLWPQRMNRRFVDALKSPQGLGEYGFAGQAQQRPAPAEGGVIKRAWWRYWETMPTELDKVIVSWDLTFKHTGSSWVVGQVWGKKGPDAFLLDQVRDKMDFPAQLAAIRALATKWPETKEKLIEDAANGAAVISVLRKEIPGVIPIPPRGSKEARLAAVAVFVEAGNVYLPHPRIAPWIDGLVEEVTMFPNGSNDDQADCASQALSRLFASGPKKLTQAFNLAGAGERPSPWNQ